MDVQGEQPVERTTNTTPEALLAEINAGGGIPRRLRQAARRHQSHTALIGGRHARWDKLTYGELFEHVDAFAAGLKDLGVQHGDRIGLVAENSDRWLIVDLAILSLGAVDVPRGGDAPGSEVQFCLDHAGCNAAVVDTESQLEKLADLRDQLRFVLVLRGDAPKGTHSFDQILTRGQELLKQDKELAEREIANIAADDLATVIYTSGTTGNPKGVMLSHRNILHNIAVIPLVLGFPDRGRYISFLPSWHTFERTIEYVVLDHGMELHYSSKWSLKQDLPKIKPHFMVGVPRLWETFAAAVLGKVDSLGGFKGTLISSSLSASRQYVEARRRMRGLRTDDAGNIIRSGFFQMIGDSLICVTTFLPHLLADKLVYSRVRQSLGGNLEVAVSGGGPLPAHVDEFLTRAGVPLLNGYGLTESSPVICVRRRERNRLGTIGAPVPLTEVSIRDDGGSVLPEGKKGVIHAKGPQIMSGYHNNPDATNEALIGEGWLNTGDVGMLSNEGDVMITGRAKDTIVLRGGENIEPEPIEGHIASSPLIAEAMVVGHGEKVLGVLLVPDLDALRATMKADPGIADQEFAADPEVLARLKAEVVERISPNGGYRSYERIGRFAVLSQPFSVEDGTLTATMKKRRPIIEEMHGDLIKSLYAEE